MLEYDSLLTCPLGAPVTISRVSDQDRAFLQFAERHDLRPGDVVRVEERSIAGDSVQLRGRNERRVTIGARAASKVLVHAVRMIVIFLLASRAVLAQAPTAKVEAGQVPFKISLGPMTLPHGLARIVLAEQLYRAATILAGHPYHRA